MTEFKDKLITLINQLNKQCFEHVNAPGTIHMQRNQAVEEVLKELRGYDLVKVEKDEKKED